MKKITMVHIYLSEAKGNLTPVLHYLHDENSVQGITIFRGQGKYIR